MRQTIRIRLLMLSVSLLIGIALHSTAAAQTTGSAAISPTTVVVNDDCEAKLATALQRLDKTLDAYEKAVKALSFAQSEIEARKTLDALKDELLKAKDQYIADVMADNDFLRKDRAGKTKSKIRKIFETLEKIALIGLGAYLAK